MGSFALLPVANDLLFTRGLAATPRLCFLLSLSLPATAPEGGHMTQVTPDPAGLSRPLPSCRRACPEWSPDRGWVTLAPQKWRLPPRAFGGKIF